MAALGDLLAQADVVSMHAPGARDDGSPLARRLARMKPTACFVNTARTALTRTRSTDVDAGSSPARRSTCWRPNRSSRHRFLALDNVIVTPHVGGATVDVTRHQSDIIVEAIERHLRGERPRWIANPAVYDGRG
jgi:autoinducer 2 (AI-2) kinase